VSGTPRTKALCAEMASARRGSAASSSNLSAEPRPRAAFPGAEPINIVLDPEVRARKREACRAYASQIGFQFGGPERLDQQLAAVGDVVAGRHQLAHHSHPVFLPVEQPG
jgi:hypothetical protein